MKKVVEQFLRRRWDGVSPLLLGYSGGPDSKALLYALHELGVGPLHVAHVDHGWRKESGQEAALLQREVEGLRLPFYMTRLLPSFTNREARAREERLAFFRTLFQKEPFQALLLAHQADDLAETVLKRLFEGAHLSFAAGMEPTSVWEGVPIWRPFLSMKKRALIQFLDERKISFISDPTNRDPRLLRSRLRGELLPLLSRSFGKEVASNLTLFSERSSELKAYLDRKVASIPLLEGPWGKALFLAGVERIEARHLIQKQLSLPRGRLKTLLDWIEAKKPNQRVSENVIADRAVLFLLSSFKEVPVVKEIKLGCQRVGSWEIKVEEVDSWNPPCGWREVWMGRFSLVCKKGKYALESPPQDASLKKLWNRTRVPAFFRNRVPVLLQSGEVVGEFLSGRPLSKEGPFLKIEFKLLVSNNL